MCLRTGRSVLASATAYLYLFPLYLLPGFPVRHGSSGGEACSETRKAPPSKRDTRERRPRATDSRSDFLETIHLLPLSAENATFRHSCCERRLLPVRKKAT